MKKIYLTVAVNYGDDGIGALGKIPWHLPGDLKHFREVTMGKPCIVGHKTFVKMPYLDGRQVFVAPREESFEHPEHGHIDTLSLLISSIDEPEIHVIGGADTYRRAMPLATHMWMTRVNSGLPSGTCDTFFPKFDWDDWKMLEQKFPEDEPRISIMHLERKQ